METKEATIVQLRGVALAGRSDSNHWVMMDGEEKFGGSDAASKPKELLLMALGGCTAMDVISLMKKQRVAYTRFEVRLTGTVRDEHPKIFTDIHIEYIVQGNNIHEADIQRAIELSATKYCAVSAMLNKTVNISQSLRIEPPEQG